MEDDSSEEGGVSGPSKILKVEPVKLGDGLAIAV